MTELEKILEKQKRELVEFADKQSDVLLKRHTDLTNQIQKLQGEVASLEADIDQIYTAAGLAPHFTLAKQEEKTKARSKRTRTTEEEKLKIASLIEKCASKTKQTRAEIEKVFTGKHPDLADKFGVAFDLAKLKSEGERRAKRYFI